MAHIDSIVNDLDDNLNKKLGQPGRQLLLAKYIMKIYQNILIIQNFVLKGNLIHIFVLKCDILILDIILI